jgi:hypothetical protein
MDALLLASTVLILATACLLAVALSIHLHNRRVLIRLRAAQRSANSHIQKSRMDLLETRNRARRARDTHNNTSNQFYKAARTTNKALHLLADILFISRREKQLTSRRSEDRDRPPQP